ncbi:MAG: hypothetical protein QOK14_1398 [Frankiaceae bacterium]|jgi:hypothetical protein|nr:hypothetical protein [Frankiaceae bacterium]
MHRSSPFRLGVALGATTLLVALVPNAIASQPRKDAGYQGASNQKSGNLTLPASLRVSKDGKKVSRFNLQWTAKCASPTGRGGLDGLFVTQNKVINSQGSFTYLNTVNQQLGGGQTATFVLELKGKFTSKTVAKGTFKVNGSIKDAAGAQVDTCTSGNISWQVRD